MSDRSPPDMAMRPTATVPEMLRQAGLRPTRQRMTLGRLLFESGDRHVTAEQLACGGGGARRARFARDRVQHVAPVQTRRAGCANWRSKARRPTSTPTRRITITFCSRPTGELMDIPGDAIRVEGLPEPPDGHEDHARRRRRSAIQELSLRAIRRCYLNALAFVDAPQVFSARCSRCTDRL